MIVGDTRRFGIELVLNDDSGGEWLFGRVCYWLCNQRIGDWELGTSLRDVLFLWERISGDGGYRFNEYLMPMETATLVNTLHRSMFGGTTDDSLEHRAFEEQWARHDILPHVDVFDDWKCFLVENDALGRCVFYNPETQSYGQCHFATGEFDRVLTDAIEWLQSHHNIATI